MRPAVALPMAHGPEIEARRDRHPPITVDVMRGAGLESRHVVYGILWGHRDDEEHRPAEGAVVETWGHGDLVTYMRSALKPFQVLPLLIDGVADELGVTDEEIALATGSHSGQDIHLTVLHGLMAKAGVDKVMLRCGRHRPYHKDSSRQVGDGYTVEHNNCSGKHAAMLAWCLARDADPATYLSPDHPLQQRILSYVSLLTGLPQKDIGVAVDGCGVPTVALPLWAMARMFLLLAAPERFLLTKMVDSIPDDEGRRLVAALHRVRRAMQTHPLLVAGEERADSDVIGNTHGRMVTKAGAEGLWCGVSVERGRAFAFKTVDGHFRAAVPAALEALGARRLIEAAELTALDKHHRPVVKNHVGSSVGRLIPHLP